MESKSLQEIQETMLALSAQHSSEALPGRFTLALGTNEAALEDVQALKDRKLITWDFSMKTHIAMTPVSNPEHMLSCVAYYGDAVLGFYCVGYAIGCISKDGTTIEIDFIEKRCDASDELRAKFLPLVIDAYATYGLYLNSKKVTTIDKIALISPVQGVIGYYKKQGYNYSEDYRGTTAMIMNLYE